MPAYYHELQITYDRTKKNISKVRTKNTYPFNRRGLKDQVHSYKDC